MSLDMALRPNFSSDNPALKLLENVWGWKRLKDKKHLLDENVSQSYLVPKKDLLILSVLPV